MEHDRWRWRPRNVHDVDPSGCLGGYGCERVGEGIRYFGDGHGITDVAEWRAVVAVGLSGDGERGMVWKRVVDGGLDGEQPRAWVGRWCGCGVVDGPNECDVWWHPRAGGNFVDLQRISAAWEQQSSDDSYARRLGCERGDPGSWKSRWVDEERAGDADDIALDADERDDFGEPRDVAVGSRQCVPCGGVGECGELDGVGGLGEWGGGFGGSYADDRSIDEQRADGELYGVWNDWWHDHEFLGSGNLGFEGEHGERPDLDAVRRGTLLGEGWDGQCGYGGSEHGDAGVGGSVGIGEVLGWRQIRGVCLRPLAGDVATGQHRGGSGFESLAGHGHRAAQRGNASDGCGSGRCDLAAVGRAGSVWGFGDRSVEPCADERECDIDGGSVGTFGGGHLESCGEHEWARQDNVGFWRDDVACGGQKCWGDDNVQ